MKLRNLKEVVEIERQISEAPAICVIVQWDVSANRPRIARFEDENGETIAYPGQDEFRRICDKYFRAVKSAVADCIIAQRNAHRKRKKKK